MKIEAFREGGSVILHLGGRLDREGAEHLSNTLEDLLRDGVRSLTIDLATVTYMSSAATKVLTRWRQELARLRGEVRLTSLPSALEDTLAITGWDWDGAGRASSPEVDARYSSWQLQTTSSTVGQYQVSTRVADGALTCYLHGNPKQITQGPYESEHCRVVEFPPRAFGLGIGGIGSSYDECHERLGELVAVAGCVAYFPSDGARMADYLVGDGPRSPRAVLASGLTCDGEFSKLVRFGAQAGAEAIPLSQLASVCLEASGGKTAGMVIAAETAGLTGARLRRSPAANGPATLTFEVPAVRAWLSFAPERTYSVTTALIAGVAARGSKGPLAAYLRPLGYMGKLEGHFHAAVFSYQPLPQRTVELGELGRGLFKSHQLRDVLHLLWDDRGQAGVGESGLVRGVAWVAPITEIS
jgi:anti-anti-sigma factor